MAMSVDAKLLRQTKFPSEFNQKVDMQKVNLEVLKKSPDIKVIQISLTGFLDKDAARFCKELWSMAISAQSNPQGVPQELLEAKKLELMQEKVNAEKAAEEARRRKEQETTRDRDIDSIRQRERAERAQRGRARGNFRGRDFDRRRPRSGSPPNHRGTLDRNDRRGPPPREADTYVPLNGGRRDGRGDHTQDPDQGHEETGERGVVTGVVTGAAGLVDLIPQCLLMRGENPALMLEGTDRIETADDFIARAESVIIGNAVGVEARRGTENEREGVHFRDTSRLLVGGATLLHYLMIKEGLTTMILTD
ncbi:MAG: hypothetical protein Q9227_002497 [Pyrenula ochraceoflavens]